MFNRRADEKEGAVENGAHAPDRQAEPGCPGQGPSAKRQARFLLPPGPHAAGAGPEAAGRRKTARRRAGRPGPLGLSAIHNTAEDKPMTLINVCSPKPRDVLRRLRRRLANRETTPRTRLRPTHSGPKAAALMPRGPSRGTVPRTVPGPTGARGLWTRTYRMRGEAAVRGRGRHRAACLPREAERIRPGARHPPAGLPARAPPPNSASSGPARQCNARASRNQHKWLHNRKLQS